MTVQSQSKQEEPERVVLNMSKTEAEWAYWAVGCLPVRDETRPLFATLRDAIGPERARVITLRGLRALESGDRPVKQGEGRA